ncbi:MAG: LuxR C-terminal-related transcriptional regulator [Muribaculaceae bacterium]|nr:LuxR C-terminal-related transcriptional regulator [Muribaculaceae bacterium]
MRAAIADNNLLLMALSRFGIQLGFGDRTIERVCADSGVHCGTFIAVANLINDKDYNPAAAEVDLPALIGYLKNAHTYFLDFILPSIRRKLIDAISHTEGHDLSVLVLKFYDEYVSEVQRHMDYENDVVFTYVERLLRGERQSDFSIERFEQNHKPIAYKLHELKDLFICHYSDAGGRIDLLNSTLFDIITCEHDLMSHCRVEDTIFIPAVQRLEQKIEKKTQTETEKMQPAEQTTEDLTDREKEVIRYVARGMSNKEIADVMCVSVHTVTTHRRNLSAKLDIHSAAGLTIYAILHKLLTMDEISNLPLN